MLHDRFNVQCIYRECIFLIINKLMVDIAQYDQIGIAIALSDRQRRNTTWACFTLCDDVAEFTDY